MIMTILECNIDESKWNLLKSKYSEIIKKMPIQMVRTYLVQNAKNRNIWRVISVWKSKEKLLEYRETVPSPEGIMLFKSLGIEPVLTLFEIIESQQ